MRKFTLLMMLVLTCVGALATDVVEPNRRVAAYNEVKAAPAANEVDASSIKQATVNRDVGKPCVAGQLSAPFGQRLACEHCSHCHQGE